MRKELRKKCQTNEGQNTQDALLLRGISLVQLWVFGVENFLRLGVWFRHQLLTPENIVSNGSILFVQVLLFVSSFDLLQGETGHRELVNLLRRKVIGQGVIIGRNVAIASIGTAGVTEHSSDIRGRPGALAIGSFGVNWLIGTRALHDNLVVDWKELRVRKCI